MVRTSCSPRSLLFFSLPFLAGLRLEETGRVTRIKSHTAGESQSDSASSTEARYSAPERRGASEQEAAAGVVGVASRVEEQLGACGGSGPWHEKSSVESGEKDNGRRDPECKFGNSMDGSRINR
jgi:hypothetical protein